jgi:hypothetical protein
LANQLTTPNNLNLGSHFLANLNPCEFHFTLNQYRTPESNSLSVLGDLITLRARHALDQSVQAQTAQLISQPALCP